LCVDAQGIVLIRMGAGDRSGGLKSTGHWGVVGLAEGGPSEGRRGAKGKRWLRVFAEVRTKRGHGL